MYCAADKRRRRAFTLLEVMLAVGIIALVGIAIYRFVDTTLQSMKISTDDTTQKGSVQALVAVLEKEFCSLPPIETGALMGEAHKFNGKASDEVHWLTQAGNGLFTQAAAGPWKATLTLRPQEKTNTYVLGLLRQLPDGSSKEEHWLPLLPNVDAIEIRYYDPQLKWLDQWTNIGARPSLVRVRIWRTGAKVPYEAMIKLPANLPPV